MKSIVTRLFPDELFIKVDIAKLTFFIKTKHLLRQHEV